MKHLQNLTRLAIITLTAATLLGLTACHSTHGHDHDSDTRRERRQQQDHHHHDDRDHHDQPRRR